jgi:hypothetical protein
MTDLPTYNGIPDLTPHKRSPSMFTPTIQKIAMLPLITGIIELGYRIQLFCESPISNQSSSISLIMAEMNACDEMTLHIFDSTGRPRGSILLIWGNSDMPHPISDYSTRLPEAVLTLINSIPDEVPS